jgi:outer membrane protein TolC
LLLTEVAYLNSRADRLAAMVALYQGLGGGWVPAGADVARDGGR